MNYLNYNKIIILSMLGIIAFVAYWNGLLSCVTLANLKLIAHCLRAQVAAHYLVSVLIFCTIYVVSVTLSFPWAAVLTLTAGYIYGMIGVVYVVCAATVGALGAFVVARYLIAEYVQRYWGSYLKKFNAEIEQYGGWYLLVIRLIPVIPFFLVNSLAGVTTIRTRAYIVSTFFGMIPPTLIFAFAGTQLATIHSVYDVFSVRVIAAFALLITLALVPLIYRWTRTKSML